MLSMDLVSVMIMHNFYIFFLSVHIHMKDSENALLHQTKHLIKLKFMSRHLLGKKMKSSHSSNAHDTCYSCSILPGILLHVQGIA